MQNQPLAGAAVAVLLLVSACGGEPPPTGTVDDPPASERESTDNGDDNTGNDQPDPPDNGADTESDPNQYDTAEDMPRDQLETEVEEVVGTFFRLSDEAMKTGDTSAAREMTSPDCKPCWAPLDAFDDTFAEGNRIVGGDYDDEYDVGIEQVLGDTIRTLVTGSYAALQVVDESGNEVESFDAQEFTYMLVIERGDDGTYFIREGADYS